MAIQNSTEKHELTPSTKYEKIQNSECGGRNLKSPTAAINNQS
jgi:hypothetical protein